MILCPLCKTIMNENNHKQRYISTINNQEYKLYCCFSCQIYFWNPMEIIPEFYEKEMFATYDDYHMGDKKLPEWCLPFFTYFPLKKGSLLDVGCADGAFLEHAQRVGFDVWGIDFDGRSIEVASKKRGLKNVFRMSLEDFLDYAYKENLKFDVITFFEVLEHQDDLEKFLASIKLLLKHNGYIAGSVPNRERLLPEVDPLDYPPHHFTRWSRDALNKFFEKEYFTFVEFHPSSSFTLNDISYRIRKIFFNFIDIRSNGRVRPNIITTRGNEWKNKDFLFVKKIKNIIFLALALIFSLILNKFKKAQNIYFQAFYMPFDEN